MASVDLGGTWRMPLQDLEAVAHCLKFAIQEFNCLLLFASPLLPSVQLSWTRRGVL